MAKGVARVGALLGGLLLTFSMPAFAQSDSSFSTLASPVPLRSDNFRSLSPISVFWPGLALDRSNLFSYGAAVAYSAPSAGVSPLDVVSQGESVDPTTSLRSRLERPIEVRSRSWDLGGEVGFFYGSTVGGKYHATSKQGYVMSAIGDDKTQITVGIFYGDSVAHFPRSGR